jgi:hypothetical protein
MKYRHVTTGGKPGFREVTIREKDKAQGLYVQGPVGMVHVFMGHKELAVTVWPFSGNSVEIRGPKDANIKVERF